MAETLVKEKVCNACGAEVRQNALFCYNCGSAVAPGEPLVESQSRNTSNLWFKDDLIEKDSPEKENKNNNRKTRVIPDKSEVEKSFQPETEEKIVEEEKAEKLDLSKMDSAATLRKRGKSLQKKRVEIVWEEHENAPNGWFIFFAILLAGLAVGIWIISKYLE